MLKTEGKVRRHVLRGPTDISAKERRDDEDSRCLAGMRNPASVVKAWPELAAAMEPIAALLTSQVVGSEVFQDLTDCCGKQPVRVPPTDEELAPVRKALERLLGMAEGASELHHPAGQWRWR